MKYATGGVQGKTGDELAVEVPEAAQAIAAKSPAPAPAGAAPATKDGGAPPVTGGAAAAPPPAKKQDPANKRLRVSMWVGDPLSIIGRWKDIKTGAHEFDSTRIKAAKGVLDDIGIISGITMKDKKVVLRPASTMMFLPKAIDACHENGVQVTLGFSIADEGSVSGGAGKAFVDWLRNPVGPTLDQYAADIMEFVFEKNKANVDGLGFDVELNGLKAADADNFSAFYGKLADLLAAKKKFLHVATGIGVGGSETALLGTFRAQPFKLAKGHPNIIIRPMAYDMFNLDDDAFLKWHKDVVNYALNTVGLDPGQFQLGLKTIHNSKVAGYDPGPTWSPTKCTFDAGGVADRCKTVLKPNNVGVCTFAGWLDFNAINAALNPGMPPANTVGSPLQVPLEQALP